VISVDTKKEELVGDFENSGRKWGPQGQPDEIRVHDFLIKGLGRAAPYGVYDLAANAGWVSVGIALRVAASKFRAGVHPASWRSASGGTRRQALARLSGPTCHCQPGGITRRATASRLAVQAGST